MSTSRVILVLAAIALGAPAMGQEMREIETSKGTVSVPADPQRVLVLNPAIAGSLYALGLDVLAVTESTRAPTEEGYSGVWADEARAAGTEVLPWDFEGFNYELLLSYDPDLIVAGGQGRPGFLANEGYDQLSAVAPTLFVDTTLGSWKEELGAIATALGREAEAAEALAVYEARIAEVSAAIEMPPQPTAFMLSLDPETPYFMPETTATPQLFADVGFTVDPLAERFPQFEAFGTGDSVEVSAELAGDVFSAPTIVLVPFDPASPHAEDMETDPILSRLPAVQSGNVYEMPDYAYRFDYYGALATLDVIEETFGR